MNVRRFAAGLGTLALLTSAAPAGAAVQATAFTFRAGDGALLHAEAGGEGGLRPRPTIVEFTPYAQGCCPDWVGPEFNYVMVQARGTGRSTGIWGAVGPRDQQDVAEFTEWACRQPWSAGKLGLYGFSASAIAVYHSLHLPLHCVGAAALMAGTSDLYRDLLYPGGIPNTLPAGVVGLGVVGLLLSQAPGRIADRRPLEGLQSGLGLAGLSAEILTRQTRDGFWEARAQRPSVNDFPVLAATSFYDPEARGPFESFQLLRETNPGTKLRLYGAHDGFPKATTPFDDYRRWFEHHLLGTDNRADREPAVSMYVGRGSREALLAGRFAQVDAADWPVPGTTWKALYLDDARGSRAGSLHDGTLGDTAPQRTARRSYPAVPSVGTASDPQTTSALGPVPSQVPGLTDLRLTTPLSLAFTSAPFARDTDVVGPASLVVFLSSTARETDIHAVVADVRPDGKASPVGVGRLRTSFPGIDRSRSRIDARGEVVQPYGVFAAKDPAAPGKLREYHVELWPIGNRFAAGHRLRLQLVGTSSFMLPPLPGVNTVAMGGAMPSRLLVPVLPDVRVLPRTACVSRRVFRIRLRAPRGDRIATVRVTVGGRRAPVTRVGGWRARIDLRGRPRGRVVVKVSGRTRAGRTIADRRTYHPCTRKRGR